MNRIPIKGNSQLAAQPPGVLRVSVCDVSVVWAADLFAHAVDAVGSQQVDGLLDQVGASAVEHPESQVLQELGLCGGGVQLPGGAETILRSADGSSRSITVIKWELISEMDFQISRYSSSRHAEGNDYHSASHNFINTEYGAIRVRSLMC